MGWAMVRTSRSPIFNQSHDFSCFVTDGVGRLVSQADGIPIHTGGGGFAVRALLAAFGGRIEPDDAFLLRDLDAAVARVRCGAVRATGERITYGG